MHELSNPSLKSDYYLAYAKSDIKGCRCWPKSGDLLGVTSVWLPPSDVDVLAACGRMTSCLSRYLVDVSFPPPARPWPAPHS